MAVLQGGMILSLVLRPTALPRTGPRPLNRSSLRCSHRAPVLHYYSLTSVLLALALLCLMSLTERAGPLRARVFS